MESLLKAPVLCAEVAVPLPIEGLFSYSVPAEWEDKVKSGVRVRVPFRNREITGYLVSKAVAPEGIKLKPISAILDDEPVISEKMLELAKWISDYYGSSWGEAIENALPAWIKYGKKAERALARPQEAAPVQSPTLDLKLTPQQEKAMLAIHTGLKSKRPKPILLYGVTGSGKSEIYIRAIRTVLEGSQSAICLVPEIALTEQLRLFFIKHFGNELEILHSKMSDGERFLAWKRIEKGDRRVILGPRSAVFAPTPCLGLLIMDEEHEGSYKQETAPRYHAREVAAWRAQNENALFVMGTATPSLETMARTERGEVQRIDLTTRIEERPMPHVQVLDLKQAAAQQKKVMIVTNWLAKEIEINLKKKEGTLLLLNRRGFSTHIHCPKCGNVESCQSCQVSLTFHQEEGFLLCHYCNYQKPVPEICSFCKMPVLRFGGYGTEKVESEVARLFPTARIARMDADSVRKKGSHEKILKEFRDRQIDILIGTQMIAKGFDFPHVTLVGVILADVGLMLPDFRSAERTFQLLTQVAGRAGRGKLLGRVLVQTYSPDHPSIRFAKDHDFLNFYKHEIVDRMTYGYPPFRQLVNIMIRSKFEKKAYLFGRELKALIQEKLELEDRLAVRNSNLSPKVAQTDAIEIIGPAPLSPTGTARTKQVSQTGNLSRQTDQIEIIGPAPLPQKAGTGAQEKIEIIGPAPLPFYKLRGNFRWHIMIKAPLSVSVTAKIKQCLIQIKKPSGVAFALDVDPLNIL